MSSPRKLDLQLPLVLADLDLQLEVDLVGHMHREAQTAAFELDLVVPSERVREGVQARGRLLTIEPLLLGDFHQVHADLLGVIFSPNTALAITVVARSGTRPAAEELCGSSVVRISPTTRPRASSTHHGWASHCLDTAPRPDTTRTAHRRDGRCC